MFLDPTKSLFRNKSIAFRASSSASCSGMESVVLSHVVLSVRFSGLGDFFSDTGFNFFNLSIFVFFVVPLGIGDTGGLGLGGNSTASTASSNSCKYGNGVDL